MVIKKVTTLISGKVKVFIAVLILSPMKPPSLPQVKGMAAGTLRGAASCTPRHGRLGFWV